jgi:hypothetical protein
MYIYHCMFLEGLRDEVAANLHSVGLGNPLHYKQQIKQLSQNLPLVDLDNRRNNRRIDQRRNQLINPPSGSSMQLQRRHRGLHR